MPDLAATPARWNDVASNKTYSDLFGDHANNTVVIGGAHDATRFCAHAQMDFWGEDSIHFDQGITGTPTVKDGIITLTQGDLRLQWRHAKAMMDYHQSGEFQSRLKWLLTFASRPASNVYTFALGGNWRDFAFCYQKPMDNGVRYQRPDGSWWVAGTYGPGWPAERPENVEGSYAVYHRSKRDHRAGGKNYRTGKVMQIYRPLATDAAGRTEWVDLHIEGGQYIATIPAVFLDRADREGTFPVTVNDDLGYVTIGNSNGSWSNGNLDLTGPFTAGSGGTITNYYAYSWVAAGSTANPFGCYNDDGSDPSSLVGDSTGDLSVDTTPAWRSVAADGGTIVNTSSYYIGVHLGSGTDMNIKFDTGTPYDIEFKATGGWVSGSMPDPAPASMSTLSGFVRSVYLDYSSAPAGNPWNAYAQQQ